tara:strand:+ start:45 stop:461 length:417 start_codon:yes stop_codon:yes gene_type:complete
MALTNQQKAKNSIRKLLDKHGDESVLYQALEEAVYERRDAYAYDDVFADRNTAIEWFESFCAAHNLEVNHEKYSKEKYRLTVKGFTTQSPYFMLWLNEDDKPHIEMGESLELLWGYPKGLRQLETKMEKIVDIVEEAA